MHNYAGTGPLSAVGRMPHNGVPSNLLGAIFTGNEHIAQPNGPNYCHHKPPQNPPNPPKLRSEFCTFISYNRKPTGIKP